MANLNILKYPEFRAKLNDTSPTLGAWITLSDPKIAEIFAAAGFDWVLVDLEHSGISITQAELHLRMLASSSALAFCRPTTRSTDQMRRLMDAGADGFILPMCNSASDLDHAVAATRFAPHGRRGMGLHAANCYSLNFYEYYEMQKHHPILIAQIEDVEGIDNIDAIASHNACDGIFLGPFDLSLSLGCPGDFEHPDFLDALAKVKDAARTHNISLGIHVISPNQKDIAEAAANGFRFMACSLDTKILLEASLNMIRASLNQDII